MYFYHRMWLCVLVLVVVAASICGFANEHGGISENENLNYKPSLEPQASASVSLNNIEETELSESLAFELYRSIRFEPPQLDFGVSSVGMVRSHTVTLVNLNRNRSVYLSSVSGNTPAFSSSFFEAKMVPPNRNTTFNVVFLPREQGAMSTNLNIHTSFGKLRLMVRGVGRECPYRLKPLLGIRAPLNATLMPEIHMYNPHEKPLQILEVYSSGGQFQLELPSGDSEAPKGLWEIPPLTTKPVIRIRFQGHVAGNYSAYIRIKIGEPQNSTDSLITGSGNGESNAEEDEQVLVIPVEFEILSHYGLYAVNPLVEFGHIAVSEKSPPMPLKQNILLKHSKSQLEVKDMEFQSITYVSGVYMEGCQMLVLSPNEVADAVVRLDEKLELELKDKKAHTYHSVELIIRADIFKGNLHYNENKTIFLIPAHGRNKLPDDKKYEGGSRLITVRNDFEISLAIYNVTTQHNDSAKLSLELKSFKAGMILRPGLSFDLLVASTLHKRKQIGKDLKDLVNYKTAIYVYTNITNFEIPIVISSAQLFVTTQTYTVWRANSSVYTKELDLGSVPIREFSNDGFIILQNRNFLPVKIDMMDFQRPQMIYYFVNFMGCLKSADINATNNYTVDLVKAEYKFTTLLNEGDAAVYLVQLQTYNTDHNSAYFRLSTTYENITVEINFTTVMGRLEVDQEKLHFANCFPGKLCSSELSIFSTFKQPIHIKYINFSDSGLRFEDNSATGSKIAPQSVTTVGRIYFRPSALCGSRCYIQQQTDESATFPSSVVANSLNIPNFDEVELRRRTELYRHFKYYFRNMDFTMTTKEMQHFQLNLMIELEWPQLVSGRQMLPTIEVNNTHTYEVKISNPSDSPILIDYTLADPTLAKQTRISLPLEVVVITPSCYLTDKAVFSLVNAPPKEPILVPGLSSITVPIKFQADYVGTICTLLHIRNNLTLYEGVWISAKTVQSQFRLGNRKPGSQTPLLFEITEKQLETACPEKQDHIERTTGMEKHYVVPQLITRRSFTARNLGELAIRVDGFWIGDQPCQGYGFQVTNCSSFELRANSSKKIEISYQSDFTTTRITRPLTLKTNLSYDVSYILKSQLPSQGVERCEYLLARPSWENIIRNTAIIMLLITFLLSVVAVQIDYSNIIYNQMTAYEARDKGVVHPTFNLRSIATCSTQNNDTVAPEMVQRNKTKVVMNEKIENSINTSVLSLKKRNAKNSKVMNSEAKITVTPQRNSMTLAEMVSWTFGTKTAKNITLNNNKNQKVNDPSTTHASNSTSVANEVKSSKSKVNEKSLIEKVDGDMRKNQISKKCKAIDKGQTKSNDKISTEEMKAKREDTLEKEVKKEKNCPKVQNKIVPTAQSSLERVASKDGKDQKKSIGETSHLDNTDKNTNSSKDNTTGRRSGKTPGRERRKQSAQNNSPVISDLTGSSCSSSTSSSCSSHHNSAAKRNERKSKVKALNSLKFNNSSNVPNLFSTSFSTSCLPTTSVGTCKPEKNKNTPVDILSPWDNGNHATFSDVLQKAQQQQSTTSTDLMKPGSFFDLVSSSPIGVENSEITAALTPKKSKTSPSDLGPIGSKKSPSSTPVWEPLQSAITMQMPRPLSGNSTTTSSSYYPINSTFGYNDLPTLSSSAMQQQKPDIHAQLLVLQRQLLEQQHLQQQQQQHSYLNPNTLNSNWSNMSSQLWSPIVVNGSTNKTNGTSTMFSQSQGQNSTWSLTTRASATSSGLVRPPPGLEQNFSLSNNLATSLNSHQALNSAASTSAGSAFNNTMAAAQIAADNEMPVFNLFGGLSSIWNDNWKVTDQQQQQDSLGNPQ